MFFRQLFQHYNKLLTTHPLRTNVATGGLLAGVSDIICQTLVEATDDDEQSFSIRRTLSIAAFGAGYNGGICTVIYPLYTRLLPSWFAQTTMRTGLGSTIIDNCIHSPVFYVPTFFITTGMLQGDSLETSVATLTHGYWETMRMTWLMWVPLQSINFSIVPPRMRVLVLSSGCFFYTCGIDYLLEKHRKNGERREAGV
jgi:protein Mpv17